MVSALCFMSKRPTSVDPVKVTLRTSELEVISPPIAFELPVNTLNTPAGIPARSAKTDSAKAEKGVELGGFAIMVKSEANGGMAFSVIMAGGKFKGGIEG